MNTKWNRKVQRVSLLLNAWQKDRRLSNFVRALERDPFDLHSVPVALVVVASARSEKLAVEPAAEPVVEPAAEPAAEPAVEFAAELVPVGKVAVVLVEAVVELALVEVHSLSAD